jgi:signal transduction histidine kinase
LAKRFIELHGGRISIESELGKGTTFTFAIPANPTVPAPAHAEGY